MQLEVKLLCSCLCVTGVLGILKVFTVFASGAPTLLPLLSVSFFFKSAIQSSSTYSVFFQQLEENTAEAFLTTLGSGCHRVSEAALSGSAPAVPGALPGAVVCNGDKRAATGNTAQKEHAVPCHIP